MSDRIAVMNMGKVLQVGSPEEIYERPGTRFVADFIGETNFLEGIIEEINGQEISVSLERQATIRAHCNVPVQKGQAVSVVIRPEKFSLGQNGMVKGCVEETIYIGTDMRYIIRLNDKMSVTVREQNFDPGRLNAYQVGDEVGLEWNPAHALVLTE
jgi:spermidine/putrescine transport system ATP-binding protein